MARLASGTLVSLVLACSYASVPLPHGASRPAAAASLLTEEQLGRFQVRIRGTGPAGVPTNAPDSTSNESPSPVEPIQRVESIEPAAGPAAKPAEAAAARAPAEEEPRWTAAGGDTGTGSEAVPLAAGMQALRTALAATKGRIEELERIGGRR